MGPPSSKRAYPRYRIGLSAKVEVRAAGGGSLSFGAQRLTRRTVTATLHDVSLMGACLLASGPDAAAFEKGAPVTIEVAIGARTVRLPGAVVWAARNGTDLRAGIAVHTLITDSLSRSTFASWLQKKSREAAG